MPGPHVCSPSGIFFLVPEVVRGGGVVVSTRRATEREKERKRRERLPRYKHGGELIQTHIMFFFGPKTSWCQALATGWYTRFPSFLFIFYFYFTHSHIYRRTRPSSSRTLYSGGATHVARFVCRMFTLQSKTPLIGRFCFPSVAVFLSRNPFSFCLRKFIISNKNFIHCLPDAGGFHGV